MLTNQQFWTMIQNTKDAEMKASQNQVKSEPWSLYLPLLPKPPEASPRDAIDPRGAQAMALFMQLDERGKKTALAMLAVAVKLHAEPSHG